MKSTFQIIFTGLLITFLSQTVFAQKPLTEGKVVYSITFPDMDLDAQTLEMMPKECVVYFKGAMSRSDLNMGMGISSSSIMNSKTGELIALTDMMGSKSAIRMSAEDIKKSKQKAKATTPTVKLTSDTKTIVGYNCKKAIITSGDISSLDVYYTEDISTTTAATIDWKEIKGFPMEYSLDQSGLKMKFTAKSVTPEKVADDMFLIPKDYKMITQEEMMKKMSGAE